MRGQKRTLVPQHWSARSTPLFFGPGDRKVTEAREFCSRVVGVRAAGTSGNLPSTELGICMAGDNVTVLGPLTPSERYIFLQLCSDARCAVAGEPSEAEGVVSEHGQNPDS